MAKYKYCNDSQSALIPVSLEEQLMPGTLEFAIHTLVETRLDTWVFDSRYTNGETGRRKRGEDHQGSQRGKDRLRDFSRKQSAWKGGKDLDGRQQLSQSTEFGEV